MSAGSDLDDEERELLAALWEGARERVLGRLAQVEAAVTALAAGALTGEVQSAGVTEAHKLAGSLGSFGLPEGSRLAKELELLLESDPDPSSAAVAQQLASDLRAAVEAGPG